jgi:DNA-binding HxlR family transcriptional regulator
MRWEEIDSQVCSIARALTIFGDRWTLLIIRDAFRRVRRFSDFQKSLGITRHRLSDRLNRLVDADILTKVLYDEKMSRYEYHLTEKGMDLYPVLMTVVQWGDKWLCDGDGAPILFEHKPCGHVSSPRFACDHCAHDIHARDIKPVLGPGVLNKLERGELSTDDPEHDNEIVY